MKPLAERKHLKETVSNLASLILLVVSSVTHAFGTKSFCYRILKKVSDKTTVHNILVRQKIPADPGNPLNAS